MKNMIYGLCGDWCMKDGKCSKYFPKHFQKETIMTQHILPIEEEILAKLIKNLMDIWLIIAT